MSLILDEFGRPLLILREQEKKERVSGIEAQKSYIIPAARSIERTMKTSLGPKGFDKILVSPDGDITVTNDGATILKQMEVTHPIAKLLVELSRSQDDEIGDGTTGVVVLACSLLEEAEKLMSRGVHPLIVSDGFETACSAVIEHLEKISEPVEISGDKGSIVYGLIETCIGSKIIGKYKEKFTEMAIEASLLVADVERRDMNIDLIKVDGKVGGGLEDTKLVKGVVIGKEMSHCQMEKKVTSGRIALLTCPFEPPKPKTKHRLDVTTAKDYVELQKYEKEVFLDMIRRVKEVGANLVACQWGFDDEANHLLYQNGLPAIRWIGGSDLEHIAIATGGCIVSRFEMLEEKKLGKAGLIREISFGTTKDKVVAFEECPNGRTCTIFIRGGSQMVIEEAKRSLHDAFCVMRNTIKTGRVVCGGGSSEISSSLMLRKMAEEISDIETQAVLGFARALEAIPLALAENSGFAPIETLATLKSRHVLEKNNGLGIDCELNEECDMRKQRVYDPLASKQSQILLATQMVKMILKIDDVIRYNEV